MTESMRHPDLQLSAYVDGELEAPERDAIEAHLRECVVCSALVAELRAVVVEARRLVDRSPAEDLWPEIARRIQATDIAPAATLVVAAAPVAPSATPGSPGWEPAHGVPPAPLVLPI